MTDQPPKTAEKAASKPVRERRRTAKANTSKRKSSADGSSKDTRFKPGQSGNPKGRPRKERSLLKHLETELDAEMQVTEGSKTTRLTKREVLAKSMVNNALKGDHKALTALLKILPISKDDGEDEVATIPLETVINLMTRKGRAVETDETGETGND